MPTRSKTFARRYTDDDLIESICMTCFLTVARSQDEHEMEMKEALHICQPAPVPTALQFYDA